MYFPYPGGIRLKIAVQFETIFLVVFNDIPYCKNNEILPFTCTDFTLDVKNAGHIKFTIIKNSRYQVVTRVRESEAPV